MYRVKVLICLCFILHSVHTRREPKENKKLPLTCSTTPSQWGRVNICLKGRLRQEESFSLRKEGRVVLILSTVSHVVFVLITGWIWWVAFRDHFSANFLCISKQIKNVSVLSCCWNILRIPGLTWTPFCRAWNHRNVPASFTKLKLASRRGSWPVSPCLCG